jgi:hypothetical protein
MFPHLQKSTKSYAEVATSATQQALPAKASKVDDEFTVVSRKTDRAPNSKAAPLKRTPMIGVRNASALSVVAKKGKSMSLFVSRFGPEVTAQDIKNSLEEQLKLTSLSCTRLKTKFNSYASFHISVNEDDFPSLIIRVFGLMAA